MDDDYTKSTGQDVSRAQMEVTLSSGVPMAPAAEKFRGTKGVRAVYAFSEGYLGDRAHDPDHGTMITVGDCASLREVSRLTSCADGDVFAVHGAEWDTGEDMTKLAAPGREMRTRPTRVARSTGRFPGRFRRASRRRRRVGGWWPGPTGAAS
ncbi:hypothetical protein STENM327S_06730 [Streptomyces tendae]